MNITSHKLADNQHKIWGTVFNQKNHAFMKEIIIVYTIESISVLQKLSCHLFVFSSLRRKTKQQQQKKEC